MSRGKKLLIVGLVLAVGFGLAWPFRKTTQDTHSGIAESSMGTFSPNTLASSTQKSPVHVVQQPTLIGSPQPHVVAKMTSTGEPETPATAPTASFDLANHPAIAGHETPISLSPVTPEIPPRNQEIAQRYQPAQKQPIAQAERDPTAPRPAYRTLDDNQPSAQHPREEVRHVVQNSDTLEKLAKRYLGDASRALEIFDLNRDVLDNPHLLPIEAELRIPTETGILVD